MAYELIITDAAHEDLDEALTYIAKRLSNETAAANLLQKVAECYDQLEKYPFMYEACHDLRHQRLGYRKVPINNYVMVYQPVQAEEKVYILRFFYGSRDYEKLI